MEKDFLDQDQDSKLSDARSLNTGSSESLSSESLSSEPRQLRHVRWHEPPEHCKSEYSTTSGLVQLRFGTIQQGKGAGVAVVEIDTGTMQITLLPTRGMGIWQVVCDGVPFKWNSPVSGPVHPMFVPISDPTGLGWLEGFDEFMVRCGLSSNGAPEFDGQGNLQWPVHGRIGNSAAENIRCEVRQDRFTISGDVFEQRLFFCNLKMTSCIHLKPGDNRFQLEDSVTNLSTTAIDTQMLYHINIGSPVLAGGSQLRIPFREMAPRDARATEDIASWSQISDPVSGYTESVHFFEMIADDDGYTSAMLESSDGTNGLGLRYKVDTLPCFIVWKNMAAEQDGYVVGLEPATNFPNQKSFEQKHKRVATLSSGQQITYRVEINPLTRRSMVERFTDEINQLSANVKPKINSSPKPGWSDS